MGEVGLEGNEVKSKRAEEFFLVGRHSRYCLSLLLAFSVKSLEMDLRLSMYCKARMPSSSKYWNPILAELPPAIRR